MLDVMMSNLFFFFFLEDVKTVYESTNPCRNKFHLIDLSLIPNIDIIL